MHCEEGCFRSDVVTEDTAVGRAIIELGDRAVAFLPGSVLKRDV